MKHTSYGRAIWRNGIMIAAPIAASVQCQAHDAEPAATELRVIIDPSRFAEELNDCLADEEACLALCEQVLVDQGAINSPGDAWIYECSVTKTPAGVEVEMSYDYPISVGCGVVTVSPESTRTSIGSHFAALSELEAASVYAFARLARDLRRHGAPRDLVLAAVRAADDEVRHTGQATALAHVWGGTPRQPRHGSGPARDLFALCRDNAVDGCVHETFGAAIANRQAQTAHDPYIRSVMLSIARDETRHAGLAEDIDTWLRPQLGQRERQAVESAARRAAEELAVSQKDAPARVSELAGFPSANEAQALARALEAKRRSRYG